jgi:hypothetical protein
MTFLEELRICLAGSNDGSLAIDSAREPEVTFKENRKHCLSVFPLLSPQPLTLAPGQGALRKFHIRQASSALQGTIISSGPGTFTQHCRNLPIIIDCTKADRSQENTDSDSERARLDGCFDEGEGSKGYERPAGSGTNTREGETSECDQTRELDKRIELRNRSGSDDYMCIYLDKRIELSRRKRKDTK